MYWTILFLCFLTLVNCDSDDYFKCTQCKDFEICDRVAHKCRVRGRDSCANECPEGSFCDPGKNVCQCSPQTAYSYCDHGKCPAGSTCNRCNYCLPNSDDSDDQFKCTQCIAFESCDKVAKKCRDRTRNPCDNDCPEGSFCDPGKNMCQCSPQDVYPKGTQTCNNGICSAGFECNLCGYCWTENVCNPPCSFPRFQCDALANKCRDRLFNQPSCANDCPEWTFCDSEKNLCQCYPENNYPADTQRCDNTGSCSSGFVCNRCNYCVPENTNAGALVASPMNLILIISSFVFGSHFII